MTEKTMKALETARKLFGDKLFLKGEWAIKKLGCTLETAQKNGAVEKVIVTEREYYTVAEIVEQLNECAYGCDGNGTWEYKIDEQGRIYQDFKYTRYKMK